MGGCVEDKLGVAGGAGEAALQLLCLLKKSEDSVMPQWFHCELAAYHLICVELYTHTYTHAHAHTMQSTSPSNLSKAISMI